METAEKQQGATPFHCPLCGESAAEANRPCTACPLNQGCEILCCPRCGYTVPGQSRIERWARKLLAKRKSAS